MKRLILPVAVLLCAAFAVRASSAGKLSGRDIMKKQEKLHKSSSEVELVKMMLIDRKGKKKPRQLRRYNWKEKEGENKFLLVFLAPKDVKGTSLLTWAHKDSADDRWIFLPALGKKLKRIAEGSKKGYFMGTDFTYEDLSPEDIDDNKYKILREETCPGKQFKDKKCWVIESVPATKKILKSSGYSKKVVWVRKDIYFTVKIEFYDKRGKHRKTQTMMDVEKVKGSMYRAKRTLMDNIKKKHKTAMLGAVPVDVEI